MSASDYLENKLLDHVLKVAAFTQPAALYMSLHTTTPGESGTTGELVGGSYARQPIAFGAAVAGSSASSGTVSFTNLPAGTITSFAIWDALSGGNNLYAGALSASKTLAAGEGLAFNAGQVTVSCD